MSYQRVLPRDLFNEANLLKCLGRLWMLIEEYGSPGLEIVHDWPNQGFEIHQDHSDGSIYCANFKVCNADGKWVIPFTLLNSREACPLYVQDKDDEIEVFEERGGLTCFTDEFLEWGKGESFSQAKDKISG